jgi:hypothetical protein
MLEKSFNFLACLGKILSVLFSLALIVLVIMAVKLKNSKIEIPCENTGTILILNKEEYLLFPFIYKTDIPTIIKPKDKIVDTI